MMFLFVKTRQIQKRFAHLRAAFDISVLWFKLGYDHPGRHYMDSNGIKVIDAKVVLWDDSQQLLSDLWKEQPVVLVFLRHLG